MEALKVGERIYPNQGCFFFHELGIYGLLYKNYDPAREGLSIQKDILKLQEYDKKHGGHYVEVLKSLSSDNDNIEVIAKAMYIHKNTLLYRKHKIIELLGHDPFSMPLKFNYQAYFWAEKLGNGT
jgi:DNA-binding PucR family transcriptional regulator